MTLKLFDGRLRISVLFLPIGVFMCYFMGFAEFSAFIMSLFLHEIAHAIVARAVGLRVTQLEVLPFGCAAAIESFSLVSGGKEIAVATAGPFINIMAASGVLIIAAEGYSSDFTAAFMRSNIFLAFINLLPALPLDGGRIIKVVLSLAMKPIIATRITGAFGVITSLAMFAFGVYGAVNGNLNPTPFVMGLFMFVSAIGTIKNATYTMLKQEAVKRDELALHPVRVNHVAAHERHSLGEVMSAFNTRKYNMVTVLGDDLHSKRRLDEREVLAHVLKAGASASLKSTEKKYRGRK